MTPARIVTLTMNPALDITTTVEQIHPTSKIRCGDARYDPGGGGINVARVAHVLGASVSAVFPVGGATGGRIARLVEDAGVPYRNTEISEPTRENFTVNERRSGEQYRFVLPGPHVTLREQSRCLDELRLAAAKAEYVVASGSLPPDVAPDFYQRVADLCRELGALLILDASGAALTSITSGVFLLKPSLRELRECVGHELHDEAEQLAAAHELIDRGVTQAVVVSLGSQGAFLATAEHSQHFPAIPVRSVVSSVGAGDAMVAAITVGLSWCWPLSEAVRFGVAAGTAMLMTPGTEVPARADVDRFLGMAAQPTDFESVCD
ncbi:1-phosphofructokinase family hexose kinase [Mycolicibacterium holsaticum]|uniref:Phosphofructokinase n=1 Tax=Mycolicibacterium holsaticum TaxID=152142 RepID=A0A1E3RDP8_9MYCO|nr:1-phosphofructokinase family hexose kinase [Mycolicibacterium holsaticum]ODQ87592.1 phosphofructokinase [Mycolicibacterium holsaticum]